MNCKKCSDILNELNWYKSCVTKRHYICKKCVKIKSKENYPKNREKALERSRNQRLQQPEIVKSYKAKYRNKNRELLRQKGREYCKNNLHKYAANCAKRRASKRNATPKWLSSEQLIQIRQIYLEAKKLEKIVGHKFEVDHIVPLTNEIVCGLHVPWNLQVLESTLNRSKGNKL